MKIAFCTYGFFRTFDYVKHTLSKHVLEPLDCDVFFSTPDTVYARKQDEDAGLHHVFSRNEDPVDEKIIRWFGSRLKNYQIRSYSSEFYKNFLRIHGFPEYNNITNQQTWKVSSSLHNFTLSARTLKEYIDRTGTHYDLVIMTRPDIRYYVDFKPEVVHLGKLNCPWAWAQVPEHEELQHLPEEERKWINPRRRHGGAGIHWPQSPNPQKWMNDNILVGDERTMLNYATLWDHVPQYVRGGICFNYETLVAVHAIKNGFEVTNSDFVTYEVWRPDRFDY